MTITAGVRTPTQSRTPQKHDLPKLNITYLPGLDILRGIAVISTVLFHATQANEQLGHWTGFTAFVFKVLSFGYLGVELFFVLSGFLITGILLRSKDKPHYFRNFYIRRFLRIVPAYLLLIIVLKLSGMIDWRFVLACLLYLTNMTSLVGTSLEYGPLWSLSVEEQFYVVWPLLLKRISTRATLWITLAICVICPILRLVKLWHDPHLAVEFKTYYIGDALAYGALISVCLVLGYLNQSNLRRLAAVWILAGLAGVVYMFHTNNLSVAIALHRVPFAWIFVGLVMLSVARGDPEFSPSNLPAHLFKFLGYISYGLYLVHELVFHIYDRLAAGTHWLPSPGVGLEAVALRTISGTVVSIGIAYLSRRFFEERFLNLKYRLASDSKPNNISRIKDLKFRR